MSAQLRRLRRLPCSIAISVILIAGGISHAAARRLVTLREAEQLVMAELIHDRRNNLPGMVLSGNLDPNFSGFWIISADWDGEGINGHYDFYHVDRVTGDVWGGVECAPHNSLELHLAQTRLRQKLGMREQDYRRLRRPGPYCD